MSIKVEKTDKTNELQVSGNGKLNFALQNYIL